MIEQNNYDLILMDLQMPEMNGWEATKHIRNKMKLPKSATPIIALTADITEKNTIKCQEVGMDAYVCKPINETDFLQKITQLILKKRRPKPIKLRIDKNLHHSHKILTGRKSNFNTKNASINIKRNTYCYRTNK